jgi:Zn ribbon nucleic-acid-binding protein
MTGRKTTHHKGTKGTKKTSAAEASLICSDNLTNARKDCEKLIRDTPSQVPPAGGNGAVHAPGGLPVPAGVACPRCGCKHLPALKMQRFGKYNVRTRQCRHCGRKIRTREETVNTAVGG